MPDRPTLALRPPGVQPALFHMPGDGPPVYTVFDLDGHPHTRTESLGVAATAARFLVTEHGEAWVRAGDDTTARVDRDGVTSDQPDHPLDHHPHRHLGDDTMTTTEPITGTPADTIEPELCWLNLADLAPHPDNPRRGSLGDLTEGSGFHLMRGSRGVVNSVYRACSVVAGAWRASSLLVEIGRSGIRG